MFYLLIFNLICTWSKLATLDDQIMKHKMVSDVLDNQAHIRNSLTKLSKDITGLDFDALKRKHIKEWRANKKAMIQDTAMRLTAMTQGKNPEQFLKEQKEAMDKAKERALKSRKWIILAVIVFIAYKKLV